MAFEQLSEKFTRVIKKMKGEARLTDKNMDEMLKEVKIALLEADVNFKVVKEFVNNVKEKAIGQDVFTKLNPSEMVVKIVRDELVDLLGSDNCELHYNKNKPTVILLVGLQGSGKTTTAAKLSNLMKYKLNKKVLLAACDVYRPAAVDQLAQLAKSINVDLVNMGTNVDPVKIAITAKYTVYKNSPELKEFLADTLEIIENDETISSTITMYKDLSSIDFSEKTNLGRLVKLEKFALPADLTIANKEFVTSDGVMLYVKDVTNLPSDTTFKQGQLVNITGYTTLFNADKEVIITSISGYDVASDLVNSKAIDWVSFKYKSYEDGTYDSFSDIALNYTITMGVMNEPTFTEGGVILIKGTSQDWTYESTMSELPTANNSTIFVQSFASLEKSAIGAINPELSNQFTTRISFGSLENAKAHYETSFVIAPYFKVNGTYHIGNKTETSIKKAIPNSIVKGCKEEVLVALANALAN